MDSIIRHPKTHSGPARSTHAPRPHPRNERRKLSVQRESWTKEKERRCLTPNATRATNTQRQCRQATRMGCRSTSTEYSSRVFPTVIPAPSRHCSNRFPPVPRNKLPSFEDRHHKDRNRVSSLFSALPIPTFQVVMLFTHTLNEGGPLFGYRDGPIFS